jgi:hypothetical protein
MHQGVRDSFLYLLEADRDPSTRKDNSLDIFFGLDDSLGSCTQLPDGTTVSGKILRRGKIVACRRAPQSAYLQT